jgi:hypothetical protein
MKNIVGVFLACLVAANVLACSTRGRDTDANVDGVVLTPDQAKFSEAAASDFTRPLIADGVLTFGEYQAAFFATVQCLKDGGVTPNGEPHRRDASLCIFAHVRLYRCRPSSSDSGGLHLYILRGGVTSLGDLSAIQSRRSLRVRTA